MHKKRPTAPGFRFLFSCLLSGLALLLGACSDGHDPAQGFYLAPEPVAGGAPVGGVDVATGKLSRGEPDLSSSTLAFSRQFVSQGAGGAVLGGWRHNFSSRLDGEGIPYGSWRGLKSREFSDAEAACHEGWEQIKSQAYHGKLANARPLFHAGLCDLYLDSEIVASLPVRYSGGESPYPLHTLSRPDGTTLTFFEDSEGEWRTTTRTPLRLEPWEDGWQVTTLDDSVEYYDAGGRLVRLTNPAGQSTRLEYEAGRLVRVTGHFGRVLELHYEDGRLTAVKGVDGTVRYTYDEQGRLAGVTGVDGGRTSYRYDGAGGLTAVVDATGNTVARYAYDALGRVTRTEGAGGSNVRVIHYAADRVNVTDPDTGASDSHEFLVIHGVMKVAGITDTDGARQTFEYDANGYPARVTGKNGAITLTTYNERGLLVSRTVNAGTASARTTLTAWHPRFRKPVKRVEPGKVTFNEYTGQGLLAKRIEGTVTPAALRQASSGGGLGRLEMSTLKAGSIREQRYEYTANGQPKSFTAANGAKTGFTYDDRGNRTGTRNALGQESKTLEFDAAGRPLKTRDANGIVTENRYDSAGRLVSTTTNGRTTTYEYDAAGRQTGVTHPDGSFVRNEYDRAGNLVRTIDQDGNVTESSYDANGNPIARKVMDANGAVLLQSRSVYDNKNQLVKRIDAEGNATTYEYDASGNQTKVTDANGHVTRNEYDANNRLVKTIDALGGVTRYEYDINGNRTRVIAPNGATTTYEYDNFNQLIRETSPDRGTTTYEYDAAGNRTRITDANGNVHRIGYDLLNRKTSESREGHPDLTITYEYDTCRIGNLCRITDQSGSTTFAYDEEGRIIRKESTIAGVTLTLAYSYTDDGKLQGVTYPSGRQIGYSYDADKIRAISLDGNPLITGISYNAANQLTGWNWSDGTPYTKTWDTTGRLISFPLGSRTRTLSYDNLGNITGWSDSASEHYERFGYDALNRLTRFERRKRIQEGDDAVLQSQRFGYDANGNRLERQDGGTETVYSLLENSNRLMQVNQTDYRYDANGNIIDDGEHRYTYDARNRLIGVDGAISYLYNANNMRVRKSTPQGAVLYAWDNDRILGEYDQSGNPVQETVYLGSTPVALLKDDQTYRIHADQIDTPRVITDEAGTPLWEWESKPFGETRPDEDVDGDGTALSYNLRFPGQYYDAETGLHYNFNRDYDPATGRYVQSDPIGLRGGINTYVYVDNNPLKYIDPYGLSKFDKFFGLPKQFWNWFHRHPDMKDLKGPDGQVPKDIANDYYKEWKDLGKPKPDNKGKQRGFADPDLLEWLIPWPLIPSELGCGELDC